MGYRVSSFKFLVSLSNDNNIKKRDFVTICCHANLKIPQNEVGATGFECAWQEIVNLLIPQVFPLISAGNINFQIVQ